ncbi:hypothetical protein [Actinoallomurus sp. NPDC052274]|uniref:hypothetical protein n=1 Tax=Actinoallomurus sp. NPDC052274 TaxID=3155420 RepID=UPI00342B3E97
MSPNRDRGPASGYAHLLETYRLVLALVPVVGRDLPRGTAEQMERLRLIDPVTAKQIGTENEQLHWNTDEPRR